VKSTVRSARSQPMYLDADVAIAAEFDFLGTGVVNTAAVVLLVGFGAYCGESGIGWTSESWHIRLAAGQLYRPAAAINAFNAAASKMVRSSCSPTFCILDV
jgi:hypothetical protein